MTATIPEAGGFLPHHHFWSADSFALERERIFRRCWLYMGVFDGADELSATMAGLRFTVHRDIGSPEGGSPEGGDPTGAGRPAGNLSGFCHDDTGARPLDVDRCGALVFARVAQAGGPTLAEHLAPYGGQLAAMSTNCVHPEPPAAVPFQANWKGMVENTLDDFHGSTVHPQTIHPTVHPDWQTHLATGRHGANSDSSWRLADGAIGWWMKLDARLTLARFAGEACYRHLFIFPNFYLASFYGAVVIPHRVDPVAPDAAVLRWQLFLPTTRLETARARAFHRSTAAYLAASATAVIEEDRPICEAVQQGRPGALGNGAYGRRERRLLDFHAAVAAHLAKGDP